MLTKRQIFEFDGSRVDTGQFLLTRAGRTEHITPTVFRILQFLLERAGEVVSKEDLMKYVWSDCFVEEGNLNRNVSTLRKALGEKPSDHKYIETIPKMGYRFIAPVRTMEYQPPARTPRRATGDCPGLLVGREQEVDKLNQIYAQTQQGHGSLVCISGDVGLGKTALVNTFLQDTIGNTAFHAARACCSESFNERNQENEPLIPWIEGLSSLAEEATIRELMKQTAPTWYREITHTGSSGPRRMKRELSDLCKEISRVHPLVIVIDDFQWADDASADLLAYLATRLASVRVLVIVCYRLTDMKIKRHPFLRLRSNLLGRGACTEMQLSPLNRQQVERYLAQVQMAKPFPADFAGCLHAKSDGNPLFLRELLREKDGGASAIRHVIQTRIAQLDETYQQLLNTASVQGREFDSAVLAATTQMETQDVEDALQELDEVFGFIERIREEELPDGKLTVRYRFAYALYQEACYATLAPTRKASLSASLADAFLTYYGH